MIRLSFTSKSYPKLIATLIDIYLLLFFKVPMKDAFKRSDESYFAKVQTYEKLCTPSSDHGLNTENVQKIIHSQNMHFDLVINEDMFHESWMMFAHKFNTPIVTICTYGYSDFFDHAMGMVTPLSHVPHMLLPHGDDMTYSERIHNVILSLYDWWFRNWVTLPKQNEIAQRYFGHLARNSNQRLENSIYKNLTPFFVQFLLESDKPLPTVQELYRKVSLILVNVHKSTSKPRPQVMSIFVYFYP